MKYLLGLCLLLLIPAKLARAEEVSQTDADKFLAFFDKFVDTIVADKDDCAKMAGDLNKLFDANADLIKKAHEAQKAHKELPKAAKDHLDASAKRLGSNMQKCGNDKAVGAALSRMRAD